METVFLETEFENCSLQGPILGCIIGFMHYIAILICE